MTKQNKKFNFLAGLALSLLVFILIGASAAISFNFTSRVINFLDNRINIRNVSAFAPLQKDFFISFEKDSDSNIFEA